MHHYYPSSLEKDREYYCLFGIHVRTGTLCLAVQQVFCNIVVLALAIVFVFHPAYLNSSYHELDMKQAMEGKLIYFIDPSVYMLHLASNKHQFLLQSKSAKKELLLNWYKSRDIASKINWLPFKNSHVIPSDMEGVLSQEDYVPSTSKEEKSTLQKRSAVDAAQSKNENAPPATEGPNPLVALVCSSTVWFITFTATLLLISILFFIGVVKRKAVLLLPYIFLQIFSFVVACLLVMEYINRIITSQQSIESGDLILTDNHNLYVVKNEEEIKKKLMSGKFGIDVIFVSLAFIFLAVKAYLMGIVWTCYKYLSLCSRIARRTIREQIVTKNFMEFQAELGKP